MPKDWIGNYIKNGGNAVAFDYSLNVRPLKLEYGIRIKGYICSSNFDFSSQKKKVLPITCDTTMQGNNDFEGPIFTKYEVSCPAGCAKSSKGKLSG